MSLFSVLACFTQLTFGPALHTITESENVFSMHLGRGIGEFRTIWPHMPYPIVYFKADIPKEDCKSAYECETRQPVLVHESHGTSALTRKSLANVKYELVRKDADYVFNLTFATSPEVSETKSLPIAASDIRETCFEQLSQ